MARSRGGADGQVADVSGVAVMVTCGSGDPASGTSISKWNLELARAFFLL